MLKYFLYTKDTDHDKDLEVHNENCRLRFNGKLKEALGEHSNCFSAVVKAKSLQDYKNCNINGCKFCCSACNTD